MKPDPRDHLHPTVRIYVGNRAIAEGYDHYFADNPLFEYDCDFIDHYIDPPGPVLDLGCGTGRHLVHLEERGVRCVGVDLSPHMLRVAQDNGHANGQRLNLVRGDLHHLPFAGRGEFRAVLLMFSTLGLLNGQARRLDLLRRVRDLLRPEGMLIFHVHNADYGGLPGWRAVGRRVRELLQGQEPGDVVMPNYRGLQPLFCHFFTAPELRQLLAAAGFRLLELQPLNDDRNGPCLSDRPEFEANGFLIAAEKGRH